jgi:hypothetical protein
MSKLLEKGSKAALARVYHTSNMTSPPDETSLQSSKKGHPFQLQLAEGA